MIIKKELLLSKEREIFKDIYNDRLNYIHRAGYDIDYNNLNYEVMSSDKKYKFDGTEGLLVLINNIKQGKISI